MQFEKSGAATQPEYHYTESVLSKSEGGNIDWEEVNRAD